MTSSCWADIFCGLHSNMQHYQCCSYAHQSKQQGRCLHTPMRITCCCSCSPLRQTNNVSENMLFYLTGTDDAQTAHHMLLRPKQTMRNCCRECVRLVKELELPIEYIVLPTFAYEHKIFLGPFSRAFPQAKVWIAPRSAVHISSIVPD